jgi:hypothetical protein
MKLELKHIRLFSLTAMALLLTACESMESAYYDMSTNGYGAANSGENLLNYQKCPSVRIIDELSMLRQFAVGDHAPSNIVSSVTLKEKSSTCEYDNNSAIIDMTLEFNGKVGPKGRYLQNDNPLHSYPFFVAIADLNGKILAKEIFAATIHYPSQGDTGTYTETLRQIIPIKSKNSAKDYGVIVGFQLSDEELAYNRSFLKAAREQQKQQKQQNLQHGQEMMPQSTVTPSTPTTTTVTTIPTDNRPINIMQESK